MAAHHAKPISPISQVLQSLGLTRNDLIKHSDQMRQFLTAEDAKSLRAFTTTSETSDSQYAKADLFSSSSRTRSRSCSNSLINASALSTTPPPPSTPVKAEPTEPAIPLRHMDSMEMVIERKSRQIKREKRGRKEKERNAPSPSPGSAGVSLDAFMKSRDVRRVPSVESSDPSRSVTPQDTLPLPPITPQPRKYYRDYDEVEPPSSRSRSRQGTFTPRPDSPTPTRQRTRTVTVQATKSPNPITPRRNNYYKSPLPSSSPPQSSPYATPSTKRIVNIVSSPGPMGPLPDEEEYDTLPYTLPPGPYSSVKPDLSYAALVGQAILSSPEHRLTLQEIYDWITIVYPHFKRNETTWMNSIRHVLSTTICFRKVPRDRSIGRTLWAIWDCDLECFTNGGFRKEFCADMQHDRSKKLLSKKRPAEEPPSGSGRKAKKSKKAAAVAAENSAEERSNPGSLLPPLVAPSHLLPLFPPTRPAAHHQPYYDSCVTMPADVIFPPLPPSSGYHRIVSTSATLHPSYLPPSSSIKSSEPPQTSPVPPSSSLPSLIPNLNSSSSPALLSEDFVRQSDSRNRMSPRIVSTPPPDATQNGVLTEASSLETLEPSMMLQHIQKPDKGKRRQLEVQKTPPKKPMGLPPMPISPTLARKTRPKRQKPSKEPPPPPPPDTSLVRPHTPPPRPSTPQRNPSGSNVLQLSPLRTPLSHKGLHMSPSPSLAHYKSHLDPPPVVSFRQDDGINPAVLDSENIRTPTRKRGHNHHKDRDSSTLFPPLTPRKLVFPGPPSISESPFRTPGARSIFDPYDPGAMLDEELSALGARMGGQDSPAGLFEGRKGLLYESPSMPSPGKWARWF
ncbi:hypothetical protein SERLADRAFT_441842 [Serpula lacrymans var. lacrymans S7.9]|uniref:Fork-head domain-containing protein n=1 Tax=Serpula lacrymans var. lacrymans (strain S7.9) TaxID=578457 RepID=F8P7U2_SERL9|nr:uncharacterized protein SERLADRAFT_441842 [Serpula lacrymans var. lacrymans S7.9]EGO20500.1 hypothetical protein SERLADRAFT_441842 [Serpula lacrymans var. lacrymans S7.9]